MILSAYMIVDGQWGSTGKGLISGYLALDRKPDGVICNFGPNAGHTVVLNDGEMVMTQQLPSAIISPSVTRIFIGPGAIINPTIFHFEVDKYRHFLAGKKILIHPRAAVVLPRHLQQESDSLKQISSTQKGTGAAMAGKTMRELDVIAENCPDLVSYVVESNVFYEQLNRVYKLQIESAQGFELGLNTGFSYPYCTSRDVTPYQIAADCGIPYSIPINEVIATIRTFPIRVGHQFENGVKVGDSGPCYSDQKELSWDKIPFVTVPEKTTVTGKIRRIFTFSFDSYDIMLKMVCPSSVFLNFVNYLESEPSFTSPATSMFIRDLEFRGPMIKWIGTGPKIRDILKRSK